MDEELLLEENDNKEEVENDIDNLVSYHCNICQTEFSVSKEMNLFSCPYCNGKNVTKIDEIDCTEFYYLPFVDTLNDAKRRYRSYVLFNPILPMIFRKKKTIRSMKKLYLPCMLYNIKVNGKISFLGADPIRNIKTLPIHTFESEFTTSIQYDNILSCEYLQVSEKMLGVVNDFNYSVLSPFREKRIKDTYIVHMNDKVEEEKEQILDRVMKNSIHIVRENVPHKKKKLKDNHLKTKIDSSMKVLVPVYMLRVRYHNKDYLFLMNGHTGESTIDLVSSKVSIAIFSILLFFIILAILAGVTFLL